MYGTICFAEVRTFTCLLIDIILFWFGACTGINVYLGKVLCICIHRRIIMYNLLTAWCSYVNKIISP